jgi:4-amino-4-deoxy-L-arabinose transferase-like glycosyltransferase/membrane-associated phospholipid phosphatase
MMSWLQSLDTALFRFFNDTLSHPVLDAVIPLFSGFPGFVLVVLLLAGFLIVKGGRRDRMFVAMLVIVLALGEAFVIGPMKDVVGRLRPFLVLPETHLLVGMGGSGSMPSSHSSIWFAATMVTFLFYRRSWRFMLPLACMVGFSRMYVGVHYPSDVLAGAILGAGYAAAFAWILNALWRRISPDWFPEWSRSMPSLIVNAPVAAEQKSSAISPDQWLRLGYIFIGVLLAVQLVYLASNRIELSNDEAYQWVWSKHLALSYYSKPPMIAYLQFLGTSIAGDTAFGVRFLSPVMAAILAALVLRFFARHVSARAGFWLVLILNCTPLMAVGGTLMTVDPPLVLFWVAAMIAGWKAVQPESTARNWLWVGLWTGLGFLSKYAALFQLLCWAIFFILWKPARPQLRRAGPYFALLIIALSTLPVIIWNNQHDWITVKHVANDNAGFNEPWSPKIKFIGEFLGAEAGLLNPFFFIVAVWASFAFWRRYRQNPLLLYFFCMGIPVFALFLAFSIFKRVLPNWIAPAVVPMFCLMAAYFDARWQEGARGFKKWLTPGVALGLFAVVLMHDFNLTSKLVGRALPVPLDAHRRVRAWSETAKQVGQARQEFLAEGKPVFLIGSHYGLAGQLSFYLPEAKSALNTLPLVYFTKKPQPENQFYFWPSYSPAHRGENAIYIRDLPQRKLAPGWFLKWLKGRDDLYSPAPPPDISVPPELAGQFDSVTPLQILEIDYRGRVYRRLQLFACRNLR